MWTLLVLCAVIASHGAQGDERFYTVDDTTAGMDVTTGTPTSDGATPTPGVARPTPTATTETTTATATTGGSCRYNCGYHVGSCSCSSSCQYRGDCCSDYREYCLSTTTYPTMDTTETLTTEADVTGHPSCRYNCGHHLGSCSCSSSCQYYGNCCYDYHYYCPTTTVYPEPDATTAPPSQSCGGYLYGSSGTFSSPNYPNSYPMHADCTWYIRPGRRVVQLEFPVVDIEDQQSCSYDGIYVYDGSTTSSRLLGVLCGRNRTTFYSTGTSLTVRFRSDGSVSHSGFRAYYRVVAATVTPTTDATTDTPTPQTGHPSCRYNCGYHLGSCSCSSSCQYYGNCCYDYHYYCPTTTVYPEPDTTTAGGSCRYNCGYHVGSCSCSSSCQYRGDCCSDYREYCLSTTTYPTMDTTGTTTDTTAVTTGHPSCRYNCGYHLGSCSCSSSCQYYGNCCYDYYYFCPMTTPYTETPTAPTNQSCGGYLYGSSGTFSSPNYPNSYPTHAHCTWYIRPGRRVVQLEFPVVDIEDHQSCSYDGIYVYDGSTTSSRLLGVLCGRNRTTFYSTGTSLTVRFRSDSIISHSGFRAYYRVVAGGSCRYNCGYQVGNCSCSSSCQYRGSCCSDYREYCLSTPTYPTTDRPTPQTTGHPSCRYNCGYHLGSCSCSSSCQYYGNCCYDYYYYCPTTTPYPAGTTAPPSQSCGGYLYGSSGTFSSPNYPNSYPMYADCTWYIRPGRRVVQLEFPVVDIENHQSCSFDGIYVYDGSTTSSRLLGVLCGRNRATFYSTGSYLTVRFRSDGSVSHSGFRAYYRVVAGGSCRYNCGYQVENCSCSSSCQYRGDCCSDYREYCLSTPTYPTFTPPSQTTGHASCWYNCGVHMGSCSCQSSCQYYGNCCYDYNYYCSPTSPTPAQASCRYNCGRHLGNCSCTSSCQYYGNCCNDYYYYCSSTSPTPAQASCRYNCGRHLGSCSCASSCQYYGNCCYDYYYYCPSTTPTPAQASCRYNCGRHLGNCSCTSSCQYYGNCCNDYYYYCSSTSPTPAQASCRYNCGRHLGSCSCASSCQYYGNCCYDYYYYCSSTTPTTVGPCGGYLFGSGTFFSPNHPGYYQDNSYCRWQLRAPHDQRIFLDFTYLQLENCCSCDYISVYDGSSVNSPYLGRVCNNNNNNNSLNTFHSTSNYMTVVFRSDSSVVGRGFKADFTSSLKPSSGRVECSSNRMNIVLERSYLNSLGYDGSSLYLNDPYCRPQISRYQVVFNFPISDCGNIKKFENGRIMYINSIRGYTSNHGEITRQSHLKLNVKCRMDQDSVAQNMYLVYHSGNSTIMGTGRFNLTMHFYTSSSFEYMVTQFPYAVALNQRLFVRVKQRWLDRSLVLIIDTCVASPSPHDFQTRAYYLVRNGCPMDTTYQAYTDGTSPYASFEFRSFQFLRATETVFIQCKVLICPASGGNSRCRQSCKTRAARDLESKHHSQTLVLGPITLKADPEEKEETHEQNKT